MEQGTLSERAMLVVWHASKWGGNKLDKTISDEVAVQHNADRSMGRYWKSLLPKEALKEIESLDSKAYGEHMSRTLPWSDDGPRILSSLGYLEYMGIMRRWQEERAAALDRFLVLYPTWVEDAKIRLNGLFRATEYPAPETLKAKFVCSVSIFPVPDAADFRVALGDAETARIRESLEQNTAQLIGAALRDTYQRIADVVGRMAERLRAYAVAENGKTSGIFRDSLVENVRELVHLLPSLNIANDPVLSNVTADLSQLIAWEAETLRSDDLVRNEVATAAERILAQITEFIA